jgi:4-hydroxy-tetrahydrodipicolinate reductase
VDAPSGTALMLGAAAAAGRGTGLEALRLPPHETTDGPRRGGGIGFAALRAGTSAGEHRVLLAGDGERIELVHVAESRAIFARGAVRAARWLAGRKPGRYRMADIFGLAKAG